MKYWSTVLVVDTDIGIRHWWDQDFRDRDETETSYRPKSRPSPRPRLWNTLNRDRVRDRDQENRPRPRLMPRLYLIRFAWTCPNEAWNSYIETETDTETQEWAKSRPSPRPRPGIGPETETFSPRPRVSSVSDLYRVKKLPKRFPSPCYIFTTIWF